MNNRAKVKTCLLPGSVLGILNAKLSALRTFEQRFVRKFICANFKVSRKFAKPKVFAHTTHALSTIIAKDHEANRK